MASDPHRPRWGSSPFKWWFWLAKTLAKESNKIGDQEIAINKCFWGRIPQRRRPSVRMEVEEAVARGMQEKQPLFYGWWRNLLTFAIAIESKEIFVFVFPPLDLGKCHWPSPRLGNPRILENIPMKFWWFQNHTWCNIYYGICKYSLWYLKDCAVMIACISQRRLATTM